MIRKFIRNSILSLGMIFSAASGASAPAYQCDTVIQKQGYDACYNYDLKATLWTRHEMKAADLKKEGYSRDGIRFYEEKTLAKRHRATLADYRRSGYDRSHLVSNDDMNHNRKLQKETFSLLCQSPHYPNVNRISLLAVEKLIRRLTISNKRSMVISGNTYDRISPKRIGAGRIAVPKETYKVVHFPETGKTLAFLIPNVKKKQSSKASSFKVELSEIEKKTGFKFKL